MSRRRRKYAKKPSWWRWLALVLGALLGGHGWLQHEEGQQKPEPRSGKATRVFEVMPDARLLNDPANDGDSFKISYRGQVHVFRLYFADCPEKDRNAYNEERLREQGQYFGGLSQARTVAVGREAAVFTRQWLSQRPFTVYTRWQSVFGSGRHYAFVVFPDGEDLAAKLVREGLARIHTTGATLPDGTSAADYEARLRDLETEARRARRGGWAP